MLKEDAEITCPICGEVETAIEWDDCTNAVYGCGKGLLTIDKDDMENYYFVCPSCGEVEVDGADLIVK